MTLHTTDIGRNSPDAHLMTAQHDSHTETITPAGESRREGVNAVELFNRSNERKRAWDELSEIDRAVLLEAVRQRREAQAQRRAAQASLSRHLR